MCDEQLRGGTEAQDIEEKERYIHQQNIGGLSKRFSKNVDSIKNEVKKEEQTSSFGFNLNVDCIIV